MLWEWVQWSSELKGRAAADEFPLQSWVSFESNKLQGIIATEFVTTVLTSQITSPRDAKEEI
jgi:hypothetical protein